MKSIKDLIIENTLTDEKYIIKKFIDDNYKVNGRLDIKQTKNGYVVNCAGDLGVKNTDLLELTNGLFKFGTIWGGFSCFGCSKLTSLEGAPEEVEKEFNCRHCRALTSLKGAPKKVHDFDCMYCKSLKTLEGAPEWVQRHFVCSACGERFTVDEIHKVCTIHKPTSITR